MTISKNNVRVPQITSPQIAIKLYYSYSELSNANIRELFGKIAPATIVKLKKLALQKMLDKNIQLWNDHYVNTKVAFEAWGLDIEDLENRYKKLKEFPD